MADRQPSPDPYLAEHLRQALAQDPRVSELGIHVELIGDLIVLSGTLASRERQGAAVSVVRELAPGHDVRDETVVAETPESTHQERLV